MHDVFLHRKEFWIPSSTDTNVPAPQPCRNQSVQRRCNGGLGLGCRAEQPLRLVRVTILPQKAVDIHLISNLGLGLLFI